MRARFLSLKQKCTYFYADGSFYCYCTELAILTALFHPANMKIGPIYIPAFPFEMKFLAQNTFINGMKEILFSYL